MERENKGATDQEGERGRGREREREREGLKTRRRKGDKVHEKSGIMRTI